MRDSMMGTVATDVSEPCLAVGSFLVAWQGGQK